MSENCAVESDMLGSFQMNKINITYKSALKPQIYVLQSERFDGVTEGKCDK